MKFVIISHAEHKIYEQEIYAYEPYVREMNLWLKFVDEVEIVAPSSCESITSIESKYQFNEKQNVTSQTPSNHEKKSHSQLDWESHDSESNGQIPDQVRDDVRKEQIPHQVRNDGKKTIQLIKIPSFDVTSLKNGIKAIFKIPTILWTIYSAMKEADHIHLRCPGNIGLLGCFVQILFPSKPKTVKYAGNWDSKSKQPLSYRLQKWILSNTFLTRNTKVLVYGEWLNQSKNIIPFFTASYSEKEINNYEQILNQVQDGEKERHSVLDAESYTTNPTLKSLRQAQTDSCIKFIFVGGLTPGKQPLLSVLVVYALKKKGYNVKLDMYGEGEERDKIENYILDNSLENVVYLHGNNSKEIVKKAYQASHFLLFISKSEGWPKVVAEAMFWACLPITSNVSCTPSMVDQGNRGAIVNANIEEIVSVVEEYISDEERYQRQVNKAKDWSRQFTLDKFEAEIGRLFV